MKQVYSSNQVGRTICETVIYGANRRAVL